MKLNCEICHHMCNSENILGRKTIFIALKSFCFVTILYQYKHRENNGQHH